MAASELIPTYDADINYCEILDARERNNLSHMQLNHRIF